MARRSTSKTKSTRRRSSSTGRRRSTSRRGSGFGLSLDPQQIALIIGIVSIFATVIIVLSLLSPNQGRLTSAMSEWLLKIFGIGGAAVPVGLAAIGLYLVLWGMEQAPGLPALRVVGLFLLFVVFEAFASAIWVSLNNGLENATMVAEAGKGGGYLGGWVIKLLNQGIGQLGTILVLLLVGLISTILVSGANRQDIGAFFSRLLERQEKEQARDIPIHTGRSRARPSGRSESAQQPELIPSARAPSKEKRAGIEPPVRKATQRQSRQSTGAPSGENGREREQVVAPTPIYLSQEGSESWQVPELAVMLASGKEQEIGDAYIREQVEIIEHTLESFGAPASVVEINQGPAITQYGVEPSFIEQRSGKRTKVKVGKIASLADDLALALAARSIRIQAPVPGKGYVGIEVPNTEKALVSLRDVMESAEFQSIESPLRIGLGQNVAGQPIATDLTQLPHLLIAGTTGAGKSVCVNAIIACLLLQNTPEDLKMVMVDPKRVELTGYNGIPHLAAPVVIDLERVVGTLQWAMREMDNRYKQLAERGVRNINEYNRRAQANNGQKMPYIVVIIDELADLMMLSPEETERAITRLAQMARATGIHMIISTQRPSVDVVTGLIKANFPARIAFAVASSTDSRVILDTTGAERLLGQGDMLFQSPDAAAPIRLQGCFVSEVESRNIIEYWHTSRRRNRMAVEAKEIEGDQPAEEEPSVVEHPQQPLWEEMQEAEERAAKYADELLPEAINLVRQLNKASTSLLQRRFRIGYTRAARMIDVMEEDGIIGPPTGTSKAREVLPWDRENFLPAADDGDSS